MYIVVLGGRKVIFSIHGAIYSESRFPRDNMILSRNVTLRPCALPTMAEGEKV